jgi:hypothetical protein
MGTTPTGRRSRRLAGAQPLAEKPLKRACIPSTRSLDAFSTKQRSVVQLVRVRKTGKRKVTVPETIPLPERIPTTLIPVPSTFSCLIVSSPIRVTLALCKKAPLFTSPFNLNDKRKNFYNVVFIIIPVIDSSCKVDTRIYYTLDINDVFYKSLENLKIFIYKRHNKNFKVIYKLTFIKVLRFDYFLIIIKNSKDYCYRIQVKNIKS